MAGEKLIVASVRLPASVSRTGPTGREVWEVQASPGGLATALRAVASERPFTWVGWPGADVPEDARECVAEQLRAHGDAVPVYISAEENEGFYEHFSNRVLWPLFHNLSQPREFDAKAWEAYQVVNQRFAEAIAAHAEPGDTVWVHDYQLALVPQMLKRIGLECAVGYFLHIPFPSSETFRALPVREEILQGMVGADLIGFHAYEYVSHFRSSALRILGVESDPEVMQVSNHRVALEVLPIGIEPSEIEDALASIEVRSEYEALSREYRDKKVILGVDRLDYTKGLPQKLLAFEELLESRPDLRNNVVLIQVASPSRMNVEEYQNLKREIDELVGRINGRYGSLRDSPLVYINQHVPRDRLAALYKLADVALVTPVRDGMNLVCLEYIAAREEPGELILSEFAGAATCLAGARLVNPYNPSQMATVLAEALENPPSPEGWAHMREFVYRNTSVRWARRFLARLDEVAIRPGAHASRLRVEGELASLTAKAKAPLVLLDYDGTLTPHVATPEQAVPEPELLELLSGLSEVATVYVVSGRPAKFLDQWFCDIPVGLVCEHGLSTKAPAGTWSAPPQIPSTAIGDIVAPLFSAFSERTPGSRIERKAASIAWHYRRCDPKFGAWRAKELVAILEEGLAGHPYAILWGARVVEVRHISVTKGQATRALLDSHPEADFVFCAGNDRTDEDMFEALANGRDLPRVVCYVGRVHPAAEYFVETPSELRGELAKLRNLWM